MTPTSPELPAAEAIELDDVLDASFLASDPADPQALPNSSTEPDSRKHLKNLSRWDLISVGAFRQTRETAAINDNVPPNWAAETPRATVSDGLTYGNMMKNSPLSTMLWHNKGSNLPKRSRGRNMNVIISPVILPVRDGDRTPTNTPQNQIPPTPQNNSHHKTRKELRRETKLKRKSYGPVHHQHQHHQHHHHHHHPNMKTRSSSSMQRTNFFNPTSSVPPLNL